MAKKKKCGCEYNQEKHIHEYEQNNHKEHIHEKECHCHDENEEHGKCKHIHGEENHHSNSHGCSCCDDEVIDVRRIIAGVVMFLIALLLPYDMIFTALSAYDIETVRIVVFVIIYWLTAGDIVKNAVKNLLQGKAMDEQFLMTVASIGAFFVGEYTEGVAVMLFYLVGEAFQDYAVDKSRKSITALMDIRPDYANLIQRNGEEKKVLPEAVKIGDSIVVKPGERIPLDGIVVKGSAGIDTSALTGESMPVDVEVGSRVLSGSICSNGVLTIKVEKEFSQSTVAKILDMMQNAGNRKGVTENFISRFAKIYTPIVVGLAGTIAVIGPIFIAIITGADLFSMDIWSDWIYRALTFLVISCPCALVISVPLSFFAGIGAASKNGILVKGSNYLEAMAQCDMVVFDKTGTLTKGKFHVSNVYPAQQVKAEEVIEKLCIAEIFSNHPIAASLIEYAEENYNEILKNVRDNRRNIKLEEISGYGVKAEYKESMILAGNEKMMKERGVRTDAVSTIGTIVYLSDNGKYLGCVAIEDEIKDDSRQAVSELKSLGIKRNVMLTGDKKEIAMHVSDFLDLDEVYYELLPGEKVEYVEKFLEGAVKLAFAGDGINDAPVLARADVGIAMGALGSDAAIEAADIVLMDDNPLGVSKVIKIARRTLSIAKQNIVFALGVKIIVLVLSAFGLTTMWGAVFADVGVALLAILNAMRAMKFTK